jgi:hypothetical protein
MDTHAVEKESQDRVSVKAGLIAGRVGPSLHFKAGGQL